MTPILLIFKSYLLKVNVVLKSLFTKKGVLLVAPVFLALELSNIEKVCWLLFWLMVADFSSGILASWFVKRKEEKLNPELKKENLISSEKLKKSGFKILLYVSTSLLVYQAQKTFQFNSFSFSFSKMELNATIVTLGFWCVTEFYSIVFENFKKMGFDVIEMFGKLVNVFKTAKEKIKETN